MAVINGASKGGIFLGQYLHNGVVIRNLHQLRTLLRGRFCYRITIIPTALGWEFF